MSKINLSKFAADVRNGVVKHSPEILTGIGIIGMVTTVVLAVRATPKALYLLDEKKKELETDELEPLEVVKTAWTCYVPTVMSGTVAVACIVGASAVNTRRNAALATAYSLSQTALQTYQEKVVETIGEKKEEKLRDAIAKDKIDKDPVVNKEVIITGKGETLCYDTVSSRYFQGDIEKLRRIENELNRRLINEMYISLNDFYYEIGLPGTSIGDDLGWNLNSGLIEFHFSAQLSEDDRPCIVLEYGVAPRYDYRNLM